MKGETAFRLTWKEFQYCCSIGASRQYRGHVNNYDNNETGFTPTELLTNHIVGVCGEMIACKWLGVYYEPRMNGFNSADIGANVQVRTRTKDHYKLKVTHKDPDDFYVVLVLGHPPDMRVAGWMIAADAKQEKWLWDPGGHGVNFFVPQEFLRKPEEWPLW